MSPKELDLISVLLLYVLVKFKIQSLAWKSLIHHGRSIAISVVKHGVSLLHTSAISHKWIKDIQCHQV